MTYELLLSQYPLLAAETSCSSLYLRHSQEWEKKKECYLGLAWPHRHLSQRFPRMLFRGTHNFLPFERKTNTWKKSFPPFVASSSAPPPPPPTPSLSNRRQTASVISLSLSQMRLYANDLDSCRRRVLNTRKRVNASVGKCLQTAKCCWKNPWTWCSRIS